MRLLYHFPMDPASRNVRLILAEKGLDAQLRTEKTWLLRDDFLRLNPAAEVPVLVEADGLAIPGLWVIGQYLEEAYPTPCYLGADITQRVEVRRLVEWSAGKFPREVTNSILKEKLYKRYLRLGTPDSSSLRQATQNMHMHLAYFSSLVDQRKWLAGDFISQADLALAAQISCLDYLGDVPWDRYPAMKDWYAKVKSRPSMRPFLAEYLTGFVPPPHYADLDF